MNNIANDLFEYIWNPISEKLLICKDDPTIDEQRLKTSYQIQSITEIHCDMTKSSLGLNEMIHHQIWFAYMRINMHKSSKKFRIFKVDHVNTLIPVEDCFIGVLQFTQADFENLILCNFLLTNLYGLQEQPISYSNFFNIDIDPIQAERDMDAFLQPLQNTLLQNITQHLNNKW